MAKSNSKSQAHQPKKTMNEKNSEQGTTFSSLGQDRDIWYGVKVLLHDLHNVRDPPAENRLSSTVNELYISEPYFTDSEAAKIRDTVLEGDHPMEINIQGFTVEEALHHR